MGEKVEKSGEGLIQLAEIQFLNFFLIIILGQ